jgi:hypothetical protein
VSEDTFQGGCLCGSLRYVAKHPIDAGYCHCRLCQRSSGAPVLAWVAFPVDSFAYADGSPSVYRSTPAAEREFCRSCGTQIAFRDLKGAETVEVNLASLDDPESVVPKYHIWTASRISWFDTADDLPRYEDDGPERDVS